MNGIGLSWFAPFFSGGGYCSEALSFVFALHKIGTAVQIRQHGDAINYKFVNSLPDEWVDLMTDLTSKQIKKQFMVTVCHSEPGAWYPSRWESTRCPPEGSHFSVGRTMFETDRLPTGWVERLNKMDEVWVPTKFAQRIFIEGGVKQAKLRVLGEPVDVDFFNPTNVKPFRFKDIDPNAFIFLSVFKWEERKGWDVLIDAYYSTFELQDNVALVILTNEYHSRPGYRGFEAEIADFAALKAFNKSLPKVKLLTGLSQEKLRSLYKAAQAFVLPSRGEGWGRPHVEAMAMELPVIATNWSGPTEYLNNNNGYPLSIEGLEEVKHGAFKGHMWARPSTQHLKELLKDIFENHEEAKLKGKLARQDMVDLFSPEILAGQVAQFLKDIYRRNTEYNAAMPTKASCTNSGNGDKLCFNANVHSEDFIHSELQSTQNDDDLTPAYIMDVNFIDVAFVVLLGVVLLKIAKRMIKMLTKQKVKK